MITLATDTLIALDDADAYFAGRLRASAWDDATAADREKALMMASSMLSRERYEGYPTDAEQPLAWPRNAVLRLEHDIRARIDAGIVSPSAVYYSDGTIPTPIQHATAELALALLKEDLTADSVRRSRRAASRQVGDLKVTFRADAGDMPHLPAIVADLIRPFLKPGERRSARLVP